jgi:hypothetical protein
MFDEPDLFGQKSAYEDLDRDAAVQPPAALPPAMQPSAAVAGNSPDGIGAYTRPVDDGVLRLKTTNGGIRHMPMGGAVSGQWDFIEPTDASPDSAARSAGFTALFATGAVGAGIAIGGPWGAGAGLLLAGSAANIYRAQKWWGSNNPGDKHEAVVSAVFGALGIAVGGYMAYRAYEARGGSSSGSDED